MSDAKQINVRFEGAVLRQLEDLAESTGKNVSSVLREAVNMSHWLKEQQAQGKKILLQGAEDERPLQVVLR
jgi:predicted transcriptional regulator